MNIIKFIYAINLCFSIICEMSQKSQQLRTLSYVFALHLWQSNRRDSALFQLPFWQLVLEILVGCLNRELAVIAYDCRSFETHNFLNIV